MSDPYTVRTSARRELENLEHRRRILERALADEPVGTRAVKNRSELEHLAEVRRGWEAERDRNRQLWIRHHEHLFRQHRELAGEHYRQMMELVKGEVVAGDTPSTNGSKAH